MRRLPPLDLQLLLQALPVLVHSLEVGRRAHVMNDLQDLVALHVDSR